MDRLRDIAGSDDYYKKPHFAVIFATLPGALVLILFFSAQIGMLPSPIYGALGMNYVDRWFKSAAIYLGVVVGASLISFWLYGAAISLLTVIAIFGYQFIVLPIWAYKIAAEDRAAAIELKKAAMIS